jgi:hypothetical protein
VAFIEVGTVRNTPILGSSAQVLEVIGTLGRELARVGLPVLPVQVLASTALSALSAL